MIKRAHERLKAELARVKAGGRNAEGIEGLKVVVGKKGSGEERGGGGRKKGKGGGEADGGGGSSSGSVKMGDVASVVARGRNVGVLVGEKEVCFCVLCFAFCVLRFFSSSFFQEPIPPSWHPLSPPLPILPKKTIAMTIALSREGRPNCTQ